MNVGQVEFSVSSKSLESVLASAKELQGILKGIDGKTYGGKKGGVVNSALATHNKVRRMVANDEKKYAIQQHNREMQQTKRQYNAKRKALRMVANDEKKYAVQQHNQEVKHQKEIARLKDNIRKDSQNAERKYSIWKHNQDKKDAEAAARAPYEYQKKVQQNLVNWGAQMQTLGATLQRVTSPFTSIYRGITMGIGYRLLGTVMDSISGAFSRYDTIQTYSKVLTNLGVDATKKFSVAGQEATDVYHNLENAVLGLPTGIDEIIESMRRYAGATGEAERATKLAIAANNAYIAGHMGEREKLFTERQLVALAGGAELSSNQWDSLRRNAPLAMKVVAKQMKMSVQEMVDALKQGTISGQEFLDVFIKAGTEGKIAQAAQVMKQTWDAVAQNVRNRLNAMGEGILHALDSVFEKMDGRNFLQHVLGVDKNGKYIGGGLRGVIDDMSKSAQEWIKANPDKILGFFENLQNIDWKGIVSGFAEMGLYLGKMYSGLAKVFGNSGLIKMMINFNILGKIIQMGGGLLKGLSTPISWLARIAMFGGGKHDGSGLAKVFTGLAGAGKSAQTAAASWQGVASYATTIAAIPAIAWSIKQVAQAMAELDKIDLSPALVGKLGLAVTAIGLLDGVVTAIGALMASKTSNPIGWAAIAGQAAGTAELAALSKTMKWIGEGLNAIAEADIPSVDKIRQVMSAVKEIEGYFKTTNPFEAIGKTIDSWVKSNEFKAIEKIGDAFTGVTNIAGAKLPKHWKGRVTKRMGAIKDIIKDFEEIFIDLESDRQQTYTSTTPVKGRYGKQTKNYTPKIMEMQTKFKQFAESTELMGKAFTNIEGMIESAVNIDKKLRQAMSKLPVGTNGEKIGGMFTQAKGALKQITEGLYDFLGEEGQHGETMMENLQQVSSSFYAIDIKNIAAQLKQIPRIVKTIMSINQQLAADTRGMINTGKSASYSGLYDKIKPLFDEIAKLQELLPDGFKIKGINRANKALERIKTTVKKLKELSSLDTSGISTQNIQDLANKIKEALTSLEEVGDKDVKINLKADITGQDQVVKDVKKEIENVKKDIEELDSTVTKKIYATLTSGGVSGGGDIVAAVRARIADIRRRITAINGAISKSLSVSIGGNGGGGSGGGDWHTGGRIGGKVQYRAHGGSIFQPRGVDVVPSMLAEGEFVVQRMAAHAIGYDVLQKLNHLDIPGAINGLYSKASTGNTINNTKNANVTVNNYNAPSVGFAKASRWVEQL